MFSNLLCYNRAITKLRLGGEVRYNFSFTLPYKHVWALSYTYRVLISPIDESLERGNNKTKPKHDIFHAVNSRASPQRTQDRANLSSRPRSTWGSFAAARGLFATMKDPRICPDFSLLVHFSRNPTTNKKKNSYIIQKNISQICSNPTKTNHRDLLGFSKP